MATLQKFKLLAAHCVIIGSPSPGNESPTTSPVINVRRRVTLRMLLNRPGSGGVKLQRRRDKGRSDGHKEGKDGEDEMVVRRKLRDLFELSSSPPSFDEKICGNNNVREGVLSSAEAGILPGGGSGGSRGLGLKRKGLTATFRQRMIRRCWKPVLVTIPEEKF